MIVAMVWNVGALAAAQPQDDDPVIELQKTLEEQGKPYQAINNLNPFSDDYGKTDPLTHTNSSGAVVVSSQSAKQLAQLQKLLSTPVVHGYLSLFSKPVLSSGINKVIKRPNRKILLYSEIGLLLCMIVFRAWRQSKAKHWYRKLWITFYCLVLGMGLGVFVVPAVVMGRSYFGTLKEIAQSLLPSHHRYIFKIPAFGNNKGLGGR